MADSGVDVIIEAANMTLDTAAIAAASVDISLGLFMAYGVLMAMACVCVYVGSHFSLKEKTEAEQADTMTSSDAAMFPLYASAFLLSLYLIFKFFGKDLVNLLLSVYFFVIGVLAVSSLLTPLARWVVCKAIGVNSLPVYHFSLVKADPPVAKKTDGGQSDKTKSIKKSKSKSSVVQSEAPKSKRPAGNEKASRQSATEKSADQPKGVTAESQSKKAKSTEQDKGSAGQKSVTAEGETKKTELFDLSIDYGTLLAHAVGIVLGAWYFTTRHWIANDIFAVSFAITAIELISLGSYKVGCILLGGLFFYDIFWVFGTDVMVTVAKSFDAPIKLVVPKDLLTNFYHSTKFAMLGLGDIVMPGVLVALLLKFDRSRQAPNSNGVYSKLYFNVTYAAYVIGLLSTFVVMHTFQAAQPALLYLVPACVGASSLTALFMGDFALLLAYDDGPQPAKATESANQKTKAVGSANQKAKAVGSANQKTKAAAAEGN